LAIKPTIYKFRIALSDLDRNYYDTLKLTVALHPSETAQRMMARVLAYSLNAQDGLVFCKGLSDVEEPDLWVKDPDEKIALWIDVGEPGVDHIKKASRRSFETKVYSFNSKSDVWWQLTQPKIGMFDVSVTRFDHQDITQLAEMLDRTMEMSITITGESAYVTTQNGEVNLVWQKLT